MTLRRPYLLALDEEVLRGPRQSRGIFIVYFI
jgi:hypothetical protein